MFYKNSMQIIYHKLFLKDIKKINSKDILSKLEQNILILKNKEQLINISNIKKLKWFNNFYRLRLWEYRLWFRLENSTIILDRFLHRKDVYKKYP